ncbi:MAG: hypothetical protein V1768_03770 [Patescibacteria group bacterium]|nr:hypothetical protein [Patescibacteria group bacterium]MBU1160593.1 hypothetical protein [Patescibacteria group bacterium]MBU1349939.1 hypothetical protein [Patescibacteria group bacterium]MBU1420906.1 hypothetical protein [Patescibacteria group bacterium]MBU1684540.1 hypothetical protein [Patescibacteria group bacterium]
MALKLKKTKVSYLPLMVGADVFSEIDGQDMHCPHCDPHRKTSQKVEIARHMLVQFVNCAECYIILIMEEK